MIRTVPDRQNSSPGLDVYCVRHTRPRGFVMVLASNTLSMLQTWRERVRSREELAARSDRELQDIGTDRLSISCEVGKPFWRA
jgi:uncharacterized protein YjiS (DUF1127 family)